MPRPWPALLLLAPAAGVYVTTYRVGGTLFGWQQIAPVYVAAASTT